MCGRRSLCSVALAAALSTGLAVTSASAAGQHPADFHGGVRLDRVFIIMLENHSQQSVIGDPNYVAMISGSNWWTNNDNPANRFDTPTWSTNSTPRTSPGAPTWRLCPLATS